MNKQNQRKNSTSENSAKNIPNVDIIDLEAETSDLREPQESQDLPETQTPKRRGINMHMILLAVILVVGIVVVVRFKNWGVFISQEDIHNNIEGFYEDNMDLILPLTDENGQVVSMNTEDGLSIVFFGNAPLAADRDSKDNLVNMIGEMSGATVYNCSIHDSYLAAAWPYFSAGDKPMDAYTFYWLTCLAAKAGNDIIYEQAAEALGEDIPEDAELALSTLESIDFNTVDVVAVLYDAYDYLIGSRMYSDANPTDIMHFTGNLEAGIELFQQTYPHIRIIVMSPPYAFSDVKDENGEYVSSDITRYGWDVLSTYVIKEQDSCANRQVTFVDNLYGTITEDNAKEYLVDNIKLNLEGRKKIAERFVYALNYYNRD